MKRVDVVARKWKLSKKVRSALRRWTQFVDRYCKERWKLDEDNPYWHNERGSVGMLAAAIWSTGDLALEELPAERKKGRKTKLRRLDIWCSLGGDDYVFEAKQRTIGLTRKTKPTDVERLLRCALKTARKDKKVSPGYGRQVGLVFAVPWVRGTHRREPKETGRLLRVFVEGLKRCDACFVAWCFQPKGRCPWSSWPRNGRTDYYFWPGVALLGRALRRLK